MSDLVGEDGLEVCLTDDGVDDDEGKADAEPHDVVDGKVELVAREREVLRRES